MTSDTIVICGEKEAACFCELEPGHDGPHKCVCGGSWTWDDDGRFVVVDMPPGFM
jgi:hypothetical protein